MTIKELAKKIIASINPGTKDISKIGDGTLTGAISQLNQNYKHITEDYPMILEWALLSNAGVGTPQIINLDQGHKFSDVYRCKYYIANLSSMTLLASAGYSNYEVKYWTNGFLMSWINGIGEENAVFIKYRDDTSLIATVYKKGTVPFGLFIYGYNQIATF